MPRKHGWRLPVLFLIATTTAGCAGHLPAPQQTCAREAVVLQPSSPAASSAPQDRGEPAQEPVRPLPDLLAPLVPTVSGCSPYSLFPMDSAAGAQSGSDSSEYSPVERVLQVARSLLGSPYSPGGREPGGFDCSGLVQYVFEQIGVSLPRTSREQYGKVSLIRLEDLQPGDLLFFKVSKRRISHVGIYVEEDRFIHAPSRGKNVSFGDLTEPYWQKRLVGAGRLRFGEQSGS